MSKNHENNPKTLPTGRKYNIIMFGNSLYVSITMNCRAEDVTTIDLTGSRDFDTLTLKNIKFRLRFSE